MFIQSIFRKSKKLKKRIESSLDLNDWMELTREERQKLDFQEKNDKMIKKKALLKSIREEYLKLKNKK